MKRLKHLSTLLCLCLWAGGLQAQVTIGSDAQPNEFSVLELISNSDRGLRLPQLTYEQRSDLTTRLLALTDASQITAVKGLMIFNTTTNCVDTWDGTGWFSSGSLVGRGEAIAIVADGEWSKDITSQFVFDATTDAATVDWYVNGIPMLTGGTRFKFSPGAYGRYVVQAKVTNSAGTLIESNSATVTVGCGAWSGTAENPTWLVFDCYNLGATKTTSDGAAVDPFTPAQELHGAKYRFGAKNASLSAAIDQDPDSTGVISGWTASSSEKFPLQASGDWNMNDNNPCPDGWRLPTNAEWTAVNDLETLNPQTALVNEGENWTAGATNFATGRKFGKYLFLPAAGHRLYNNGALYYRGSNGYYWSSTQSSSSGRRMYFDSSGTNTYYSNRAYGFSVRCVAE